MLKGSDYIAKFIEIQNVDVIFGLTGGYIHHTIDSICSKTNIKFITLHHEQAASFAANGYTRICGKPGICLGISGPGGINMLAGVADAYYDSYPVICITGQVNLNEMVKDRKIRQHGFQECDIVSIMKSVTKNAELVKTFNELVSTLNETFKLSLEGRKGPCLIDIPLNIQCSIEDYPKPSFIENKLFATEKEIKEIENLLLDIANCKKPLILLGGGINSSGYISRKLILELINILEIPCVHSLLACDVIPFTHPSYIGMIGTYGIRAANNIVMESETLLVIGSRLDMRQTGSNLNSFQNRNIYQVDIDKEEVNFRVKNAKHIHLDIQIFLKEAINIAKDKNIKCDCTKWKEIIKNYKETLNPDFELIKFKKDEINPNMFMSELSIYSQKFNVNYTVGIGNIQMWAAQSIKLKEEQRLIIPGGLSSMGSALPMAVGACFALNKNIPYIVIEGDGGIQLNIQELQTIVRNHLPIKIVIMNNSSLGMLRQFCKENFDSRYNQIDNSSGFDNPDFTEVSKAYKIESYKLENINDIDYAFNMLWKDPKEPFILEVIIPIDSYVAPKVPYGNPLNKMLPEKQGEYYCPKRKFIINK